MDKKAIIELLKFLLTEINYIRTHTDEHNVLAECNLMESKIREFEENIRGD